MAARSNSAGRGVHWNESTERWVFTDNGKPVGDRTCKERGAFVSSIKPDPCLGKLPGVKHACCGHGKKESAYVMFENGIVIRGFELDKDF